MPTDRKQRRLRRRYLRDLGTAALTRGLRPTPERDAVLGLAIVLQEALTDTARADRASHAAALMHRVFEASLKAQPPRLETACKAGCDYCCHNWVSATAPELFLLARSLRGKSGPMMVGRLRATASLSIADRFGRKLPCALLADGRCGVYAQRPTVCRQTTSTNLAACVEEFEGKDFDGEIVVSRVMLDHARNCRVPLQVALEVCGLSQAGYELSAGLLAAMCDGAEAAWLGGGDTFNAVATAPEEPAEFRQLIGGLAQELRGV